MTGAAQRRSGALDAEDGAEETLSRSISKERLLEWVDRQTDLDVVSKFLLVKLAMYADAHGQAWAKVSLLASHCNVSERTVQGRLRALEAEERLAATGDFHRIGNLRIPIYQIAPRHVFEVAELSTPGRMRKRLARASRGENPAPLDRVRGENPAPLNAEICAPGVQLFAPLKELSEPTDASASGARDATQEFDRVFAAWTERGPGATSYAPALREWLQLADGWGQQRLAEAALQYLRWNADARRGDPKALQYWLRDLDFKAMLPRAGNQSGALPCGEALRPVFADAHLRAMAVAALGEPFVLSWLDGCGWDAGSRMLVARSPMAFDRLTRQLGARLREAGVELVCP